MIGHALAISGKNFDRQRPIGGSVVRRHVALGASVGDAWQLAIRMVTRGPPIAF